jgi:hypothetical protein
LLPVEIQQQLEGWQAEGQMVLISLGQQPCLLVEGRQGQLWVWQNSIPTMTQVARFGRFPSRTIGS